MSNSFDIADILGNSEYCILHGWQSLPNLSSDLDISVKPNDLELLEESFLSYKNGKLVQLIEYESSCFLFILAIRNGNGIQYLHVDTSTDYRRDGRIFFTAEHFNRLRQRWNGLNIISPEGEFAYQLVKGVLKGQTRDYHKVRFNELIQMLGFKRSKKIATDLFGRKLGSKAVSWISENDWVKMESNHDDLKKGLLWKTIKKDPFNPLRYRLLEIKRVIKRILHPTGLFVVLLGPDGSGKSTLINNMMTSLSGAFRKTAVYHLRPSVFENRNDDKPVTNPHGKPPRSALVSAFKILYYVSDNILGYLLNIRTKLVMSTLVVFDRYYDDLLVDPKRYRYGGWKWLIKLGRYFIPKPDLVLILDVPENELLSRKNEVSREELSRQRTAYRELASNVKNAHIIDGSADTESVSKSASEIIMDHLHNRYIERRGVWFENEPNNALDWLNSILSADNKKTFFSLSNSKVTRKNPEWGTYKKFKYISLKDGRGYLMPFNRDLYSKALELYNVQSRKAKLFKVVSGITGGKWFTIPVRLIFNRELKYSENNEIYIFEYFKKLFNRNDVEFAVSLGTPGPHRKPVIQVMSDSGEGEVVAFVKIGSDCTNALVQNEANTLKCFTDFSSELFCIPSVLKYGWWKNHFFAIQPPSDGDLLPAPQELNSQHIGVLNELAEFSNTTATLGESKFWKELKIKLEAINDSDHFLNIINKA
ncbi:MAG: dTMP kinase, partial [Thermodesulfobacteriota bacterium]